jgi:hypothetical protein
MRAASLREIILHICRRCSSREVLFLMEDRSRNLPSTSDTARGMHGRALGGIHSASSIDRFFEKAKRLSFSVCDAYLRIQGIHDILLPPITIVIPVAGQSQGLRETVDSLLSTRYTGLSISIVGLKDTAKIVEKLRRHPSIKFFEAPSEAAIAEAMRPILLWATSPIVAWLAPGDSFSSNVLHQVGETFRRNRAGAVLVPKRGSFTERPAGQAGNLDFGFLSAQNSSFPVKIFVDRERFWAAAKTFAGTNYDCSDWAVALNTARFSGVRLLGEGYYQSINSPETFSVDENQKIKARIRAQMWWTERFRQSVWRLYVSGFDRFASRRLKDKKKSERLLFPENRFRMLVPPVFIDYLTGFSSGKAIEFLGTYRWLFATPITRSVYLDRETEVLIFHPPTGSNQSQAPSTTIEVKVGSEEELRTQALTRGATSLLQGLSEPLRGQLGRHVQAAFFDIAKPVRAAESLVTRPETANQTVEFNPLFDLLVIEQPLSMSRRPHVLLRRAANQLKCSGWLIIGCTIFDFYALDGNWPRSPSLVRPDHELCFSAKALEDLVQVAGFTPRHVLGLTESQVKNFAWESATRAELIRDLAQTLFQTAPVNGFKKSCLVILACQRTF